MNSSLSILLANTVYLVLFEYIECVNLFQASKTCVGVLSKVLLSEIQHVKLKKEDSDMNDSYFAGNRPVWIESQQQQPVNVWLEA